MESCVVSDIVDLGIITFQHFLMDVWIHAFPPSLVSFLPSHPVGDWKRAHTASQVNHGDGDDVGFPLDGEGGAETAGEV